MIQSRIRGLGRRVALVAAVASLAVGFSAASASAEIVVAPNAGLNPAGQSVNVSGTTAPTGTELVGVVGCNLTASAGSRCELASATPTLQPVSKYLTEGITISVSRGEWIDYDFTKGFPPAELESTTTCLSAELEEGDQCGVVVNFYTQTEKGPKPVSGPGTAPYTFQ